jgi:hypothetical protein
MKQILAAAILLLLASQAVADKPRFGDTFSFSLGGMTNNASAEFASTHEDFPIDRLTMKELGMGDDATVVWADFSWQFFDRWRLSLNYSSFSGDGFNSAGDSGNFNGLEWAVGATLDSQFDMDLLIADVTWDFIKTDKAHLGVGLGLHATQLDFDITAEVFADIGGIIGGTEFRTKQASVLAPLPNVTLTGGAMLGESVYIGATLGWFSLSYDKYDGELLSVRASIEWRPWRNFGLGAAYQFVDIDVTADEENRTELYDLVFKGPVLFLSFGF